jgi:hypothetical protein
MNWPYYSEDEIELALSRLINLNPFIETEREDWFELADWLKGQLDLIGDIERHRLHYAINFVSEGQTFSRHKDYYEQERDIIIQILTPFGK